MPILGPFSWLFARHVRFILSTHTHARTHARKRARAHTHTHLHDHRDGLEILALLVYVGLRNVGVRQV